MEEFKASLTKILIDDENIIFKTGPLKDKYPLNSIVKMNLEKNEKNYMCTLNIVFNAPSGNSLKRSFFYSLAEHDDAKQLFDRLTELCPSLQTNSHEPEAQSNKQPETQYKIGPIICPKCGSTQIDSHRKYRLGNVTSEKDIIITCLNCGSQWHPGSVPQNFIPVDPNPQSDDSEKDSTPDPAEEIKKYKKLLDGGFITEEDYEAKKKQILGL